MGTAQLQIIKGVDLVASPIYCLGYSQDIQDASESESTNTILKKLKEYEGQRVFKYRIRDHHVLQYFYQYCPSVVVVKPWKKEEIVLGIMSISSSYSLKVQGIMTILRKELGIEEKESIFLYLDGKLCQLHQSIMSCSGQGQKKIKALYFSKMQISG